jgi:molybdopterin synthase catalytic subunit
VEAPRDAADWVGITPDPLPVERALDWVVLPSCGAVVLFSGTTRDHAEGREGVTHLSYEAYEEQVGPRLEAIATEARARWPEVGRLVLLHRIGTVPLGESSVIVVASAPHRPEAFAAARFAIDALKAGAPIWKRESWTDGDDWAPGTAPVDDVRVVGAETLDAPANEAATASDGVRVVATAPRSDRSP